MDNKKIAAIFEEMGNILEISGADFFRVNAYKRGALTVENLPHDLRDMVEKNRRDIVKIPGIGAALRDKIVELVQTGKCKEHEKMKKGFPAGLLEMLQIRGLGPKKVKLFYSALKIKSVKELKAAAKKHLLRELEGMGEKSEADILKAIDEHSRFSTDRHLIDQALLEAERYIEYMRRCKTVQKIEYAGSLRRGQETIGDIDILVIAKNSKKIMDHFVAYPEVINVVAEGETKSSVILESGIDVDLRVVAEESFGAALHYFTGDKAHNVRIRDLAKRKGLKVNEYGVFKGVKMIGGKKENDIFDAVGLPFIIPELRQNDGEIEYALKHKTMPRFIELSDICGDLHTHSTYSDGDNSIEEMAQEFIRRGYSYFAVTDHSSLVTVADGMGVNDIKKQWKEIEKLQKKYSGKIRIFKGCEVDILKNGSMDFGDEILEKLDIVIASAHMYTRMAEEDQTARLIAAVENPYVMILGHPSGRLLNKRAEMQFNVEKVIDACVKNNVALEINSNPQRLDLADKYVRIAKSKGAKFAIDTDAHSPDQAENMKFGVGIARRGWLEKKDVINAQIVESLKKTGAAAK